MSYQLGAAFQTALFSRLSSDVEVAALIGGAVYDVVPAGTLPETYVLLGDEAARGTADPEGAGALHDFTLSIVSTAQGFLTAKTVAAAIGKALELSSMTLSEGRVVWMRFRKARAHRTAEIRQIDLKYRAYLAAD